MQQEFYYLREGAQLTLTGDVRVGIEVAMLRHEFDVQSPGVRSALKVLATRKASDDELLDLVVQADGDLAVVGWQKVLTQLTGAGFIARDLWAGDVHLYSVLPDAFPMVCDSIDVYSSSIVSLSRFAVVHQVEGFLEIETPRSGWRIRIVEPALARVLVMLAKPKTVKEQIGEGTCPELSAAEVSMFIELLARCGMLAQHDSAAAPSSEALSSALVEWSFHDLLFHQRSRMGRTQRPFGGTYRFVGTDVAPTHLSRGDNPSSIALETPERNVGGRDQSFFEILDSRRSTREFDDENPLTINELGELLWRTTRLRASYEDDMGGVADRPYPSGGAVHELDIYPAVRVVDGLDPGLFRYEPAENSLVPLARDTPEFRSWFAAVPPWPESGSLPQVTLVIAARFGRVMWKYEAMAYALMLKNVGVVMQTLYLAATAMKLGGCALGAGDSEGFSRLCAVDPYVESSVGEFALGRPASNLSPRFSLEFEHSISKSSS